MLVELTARRSDEIAVGISQHFLNNSEKESLNKQKHLVETQWETLFYKKKKKI